MPITKVERQQPEAISPYVNVLTRAELKPLQLPPKNGSVLDIHDLTYSPGVARLGEDFLKQFDSIPSISIFPPETPNSVVDAAIAKTKGDRFYYPFPIGRLVVASDEAAERMKKAFPELPILGSNSFQGFIKEDEINNKYGAKFTSEVSTGTLHRDALILDRLILSRNRPQNTSLTHINSETLKIVASPIRHATLIKAYPNTIYVEKNYGASQVAIGTSPENISNQLAQLFRQTDLEPSDNIVVQRWVIDHTPLSTGRYGQALTTLIVAKELADLGFEIGKVMSVCPVDNNELFGKKAKDYEDFLKVIGDTLQERRLLEATPDDFKAINMQLAKYPNLGQLLPSLNTLLREDLIDLDRVAQVEKQLHATQFPGISRTISDFMPGHLVKPDTEDTPSKAANMLDKVIQAKRIKPKADTVVTVDTSNHVARDQNGTRHREAQFGMGNDERSELDENYQGLFLFNRGKLYLEEAEQELTEPGRKFINDQQIPIILPAFSEPTGYDVARASSQLAPGRVILVSPDRETLFNAAPYCFAIDENEVKKFINFGKLREIGIIPSDREVAIRGKGTTILAGWLWGMAHGFIQPGKYAAHIDTDIINMDEDSLYYSRDGGDSKIERPYRPLEYMAASLAQMPSSHRAVAIQPAKVGPPRKGEVKHPTFQAFMNSDNPFLRAVGNGLGRVVWPSPGEAMVLSDLYSDSPWQATTGFDLNRYFNAVVKELVKNGEFGDHDVRDIFAQVIVPPDKIENGSVPEKNDWAEVNWATTIFTHALEFYDRLYQAQKSRQELNPVLSQLSPEQIEQIPLQLRKGLSPALPVSYTIDHIIEHNARWAGTQDRVLASESPESHRTEDGSIVYPAEEVYKRASGPNSASYRWNPFYLPSPNWLIENGIVDLDGIKERVQPIPQYRTRVHRWPDET